MSSDFYTCHNTCLWIQVYSHMQMHTHIPIHAYTHTNTHRGTGTQRQSKNESNIYINSSLGKFPIIYDRK